MGGTVLQQLRAADVIVLNKIDLVDEQQRIEVIDWLVSTVTTMHIVEAVHSVVPLELLLGEISERESLDSHPERGVVQHHSGQFSTWSFVNNLPFQTEAFRTSIATLPSSIIRAKGIVWLSSDLHRKTIFQLVGKRWTLEPGDEWGDEMPQNQLVVISASASIDREQCTQLFHAALVTKNPASLHEQ